MSNGHIEHTYPPQSMDSSSNKVDVKTVVEWSFKLISMIILPLVIWMITLLISVDKRLSIIEGNRFTSSDGIQLREDINSVQRDIISIQADIDDLQDCQVNLRLGNPDKC